MKTKAVAAPLRVLGVIFATVGVVFTALGVGLSVGLTDGIGWAFLLSFGLIGLIFLAIGVSFLLVELRKRRRRERLLSAGHYVRAELVEAAPCYNINVNGRNPYVVTCRYVGSSGVVHLFHSDYLNYDPTGLFISNSVLVYVDENDFSHYYVDLDSVLPRVEIH